MQDGHLRNVDWGRQQGGRSGEPAAQGQGRERPSVTGPGSEASTGDTRQSQAPERRTQVSAPPGTPRSPQLRGASRRHREAGFSPADFPSEQRPPLPPPSPRHAVPLRPFSSAMWPELACPGRQVSAPPKEAHFAGKTTGTFSLRSTGRINSVSWPGAKPRDKNPVHFQALLTHRQDETRGAQAPSQPHREEPHTEEHTSPGADTPALRPRETRTADVEGDSPGRRPALRAERTLRTRLLSPRRPPSPRRRYGPPAGSSQTRNPQP